MKLLSKGKKAKVIAFYVIASFILSLIPSSTASAWSMKSVKVGYYEMEGVMNGAADGVPKSGYIYEYLRKIADYVGWNYEYVYGELGELTQQMRNGKLDIIVASENDAISGSTSVKWSDQPAFSDNVVVYKKSGDTSIKSGYISSLYGKKIGVLRKSVYSERLYQFISKWGFTCSVLEYNTEEELLKAFNQGDVSMIAISERSDVDYSNLSSVYTIGVVNYYFFVNYKDRTVLSNINSAVTSINTDSPYYTKELRAKYLNRNATTMGHSDKELAWFRTHDSIKVGYLENYMPYSGYDEFNEVPDGLFMDIYQ